MGMKISRSKNLAPPLGVLRADVTTAEAIIDSVPAVGDEPARANYLTANLAALAVVAARYDDADTKYEALLARWGGHYVSPYDGSSWVLNQEKLDNQKCKRAHVEWETELAA